MTRYEYKKAWAEANKESVRQSQRKWIEANPEKRKESSEAYRKNNQAYYNAYQRKRTSMKLGAVPKWHTEFDEFVLEEMYDLAKRRSLLCGKPWEVDHIIPITNSKVCGLHTPKNMRVVTRTENRAKNNKYDEDIQVVLEETENA
jgi:5-methylcytosine-specific restriction endonuclease McrA